MLNINDLEKRWVQYKIKSTIPYIVTFLTLIFAATALYFFLFQTKTKENLPSSALSKTEKIEQKIDLQKKREEKEKQIVTPQKKKEAITVKKVQKQEIKKIVSKPLQTETKEVEKNNKKTRKEKKIILQPSMTFLEKLQRETQQEKTLKKSQPKKKHIQKIAAIELPKEEFVQNSIVVANEPKKEFKKENVKINIRRRESQNDIKEVLARFQKNNNPALSLFAAKKYYELGNYKQAYNYALITNKINNDIEESWLIFSKALVKLGKKEEAIKTLKKYINYSNSSNAEILLDEIQRGKFR